MAPPHISREKASARISLVAAAPLHISRVRTRVARRLWWASRMVVSVRRSFFCPRTQSRTASGPLASRSCLSPSGRTPVTLGKRGVSYIFCPAVGSLTTMLPMYLRILVALSLGSAILKSSGVSSMNLVWHFPARKVGWLRMLPMKGHVGLYPPDPGFAQGADGLGAGAFKAVVRGGDLHQEAVVIGGNFARR